MRTACGAGLFLTRWQLLLPNWCTEAKAVALLALLWGPRAWQTRAPSRISCAGDGSAPTDWQRARSASPNSGATNLPWLLPAGPKVACLSYPEIGSWVKGEPLPGTPFMAGSGGGWIAASLVLRDRVRVWSAAVFALGL